jgi:hypothetical protein
MFLDLPSNCRTAQQERSRFQGKYFETATSGILAGASCKSASMSPGFSAPDPVTSLQTHATDLHGPSAAPNQDYRCTHRPISTHHLQLLLLSSLALAHDFPPLCQHVRKQHIEARNIRRQHNPHDRTITLVDLLRWANGLVYEPRFAGDADGVEDEEGVVPIPSSASHSTAKSRMGKHTSAKSRIPAHPSPQAQR